MISYDSNVLKGPSGCWLSMAHYYYKGGVTVVPYNYYCNGHLVTGFTKYDLLNATQQTASSKLPTSIYIRGSNSGSVNSYGYRIESSKFDNNLTSLTSENDPEYGLYLDGCYNMDAPNEFSLTNHVPITLEKNCLANYSGEIYLQNNDNRDPVYIGDNCCPNATLRLNSNTYVSRVGANSFKNIRFGNDAVVGNIDPNCCVNMTTAMYFGNLCRVYSDLELFILAHKDRCDELGIKAISFGNDVYIYNANYICSRYSSYLDWSSGNKPKEVSSYAGIIIT